LAVLRAVFLADLRADFLPDFLAEDFRAAFLAPFFAVLLPDFLADFLVAVFLAAFRRGRAVLGRAAGSLYSSKDDGEEEGAEEGMFSIGSGSIHPEPDQPISI